MEQLDVVRSEAAYSIDEQVHDAVCAMLLTKAIPECIDVRAIERVVIYGITPDRPVSRPESWIAAQFAAGEPALHDSVGTAGEAGPM